MEEKKPSGLVAAFGLSSAPKPGQRISFGDNVIVRSTAETRERGLANVRGQVYGETTPSITGVAVIGDSREDLAINVFFEERNEEVWFAPDLLELADHAPGTEIRLKGVAKKWTRNADGSWSEEHDQTADDEPRER